VAGAFVLLADHVQVALDGGRDSAFASAVRGLADDRIAGRVLHGFQAQAGGQRQHIIAGGGLLFRGARNGRQGGKVLPDGLWFEMI